MKEGFKNEQKCFEHIQDYKNSFPETFVRALIRRYWIKDNGRLDKELVKYIRKEDL